MGKQIIATSEAPPAVGPYSQATKAGDWVFLSGQIPLDPGTGQIVPGGIVPQTRRVLENLGAVLRAAGANFEAVVRANVYLTSLDDFAAMNEVYATYFPKDPPARATVEVRALPRGAAVEIELTAYLGA
jgi:2-iminobutanoate/2-iminopropanoate deaminase